MVSIVSKSICCCFSNHFSGCCLTIAFVVGPTGGVGGVNISQDEEPFSPEEQDALAGAFELPTDQISDMISTIAFVFETVSHAPGKLLPT
jgi:hypothetical protein